MFDLIHFHRMGLKDLRVLTFLNFAGSWLYSLRALHLKLFTIRSRSGVSASALISSLAACLVSLLYSLLSIPYRYLGDLCYSTLKTRTQVWYTASCLTLSQPHTTLSKMLSCRQSRPGYYSSCLVLDCLQSLY